MTERIWITVSGILLVLAAGFVWRNNYSVAFGIAALGACAWFLGYRARLKTKFPEDVRDQPDDEQSNED